MLFILNLNPIKNPKCVNHRFFFFKKKRKEFGLEKKMGGKSLFWVMSVHGLFGPRHLNSVYVKKSTNRTIAENVKHEIILKENYSM